MVFQQHILHSYIEVIADPVIVLPMIMIEKMKTKKYHTVGTILKQISNSQKEAKWIPITH